MQRERIDKLLVDRGLAQSRTKAQALVMAGVVLVDEQLVNKRLQEIMDASFDAVVEYAEAHKVNNRIAAYMLALDRVCVAIKLRGIYA